MQDIVIQTFVAAPPDAVWAALLARTDALFDGLPVSAWPERREEQAPFHFVCAWPATPQPTTVSVTLHELGQATRVEVRHQGWLEGPAWDEAIQGHFAGWLHGLAVLGLLIETGRDARVADAELKGKERYLISGEVPAGAAAIYRSLSDPTVLERWSEGVLDGALVVEAIEDKLLRWRLSPRGELVALLRPTPRGTHVALAEYGVTGRASSNRWPAFFERLTGFLG